MVKLVDRMLELNKQKHSGKLAPSQVERVDREIAATDAEIDELVYDLYGITDEERKGGRRDMKHRVAIPEDTACTVACRQSPRLLYLP